MIHSVHQQPFFILAEKPQDNYFRDEQNHLCTLQQMCCFLNIEEIICHSEEVALILPLKKVWETLTEWEIRKIQNIGS